MCTELMGLRCNRYDKTPRSTAVLEKLTVYNLVKFYACYVNRRLITVFVRIHCGPCSAPVMYRTENVADGANCDVIHTLPR